MNRSGMMRRLAFGVTVAAVAAGGLRALDHAPATPVLTAQAAEAVASGLATSGEGRVQAAPDVAYVNVGVVTQGATANEAIGKNGAALTAVVNKVKELGVADADIQTSDIALYPQYTNEPRTSGQPPTVAGYQASTSLRITVNDIGKAVWVLDGAVQAGANQAHGVQFGIKDPNGLRLRALQQAAQQARSRADAIAAGLGLRVVGVRSASDGFGPQPYPVKDGIGAGAPGVAAPVAAPVPVQPGQLTISEHVSVVFDVAP